MPDDPMFDTPEPAVEGAAAPQPAVPIDDLREALAGVTQPMEQARAADQAKIEELRQALANVQQQVNAGPEVPVTDFNEAFFENPEETVEKKVNEQLNKLGPALQQLVTLGSTAVVDRYMQEIDKDYGPGAWNEHFNTIIQARLADESRTNPMVGSDVNWMQREVLAIQGLKMNELMDVKSEFESKTQEDSDSKMRDYIDKNMNTTTMTGGFSGAPRDRDAGPTEMEQDYIDQCSRAGAEEISIDTLRRNMECGSSLDDWQAANKAAGDK